MHVEPSLKAQRTGVSAALSLLVASLWFVGSSTSAAHSSTSLPITVPSDQGGREAFVKWAKQTRSPLSLTDFEGSISDLKAFGDVIGDAPLVALGEGFHGAKEPLEFRNRLFRYLVENMRFTAIAIESGIVEGRLIHDYVRGAPGEMQSVLSDGLTWNFDKLPQNAALIRWLRSYNADSRHSRKINFYGFDIPGSPGIWKADGGPQVALLAALDYLSIVDAKGAAALRTRLGGLLDGIRFGSEHAVDVASYEDLNENQRNALTAAISDLLAILESREVEYTAVTSKRQYQWAYRSAVAAWQVDQSLRQIPLGWKPFRSPQKYDSNGERLAYLSDWFRVRDRAQADNIDWIVQQEAKGGRILVYAHNWHVGTAWMPSELFWKNGGREPAGGYLRSRYGLKYVAIGNLINEGTIGCSQEPLSFKAQGDSLEELGARIGLASFFVDLRSAPAPVKEWLDRPHMMGALHVPVAKAYDALVYFGTVTPACDR